MQAPHNLGQYLTPYKRTVALGFFLALTSNALALVPPRMVKFALDLLKSNAESLPKEGPFHTPPYVWTLVTYGVLILVFSLGKSLFSVMARRQILILGKRIEFRLRNKLYGHLQRLPLSFYSKRSVGDVMTHMSEDVTQVGNCLGQAVWHLCNSATVLLMILPCMFLVNRRLFWYACAPLPFLAFGSYYLGAAMRKSAKMAQGALSELSSQVRQTCVNVPLLQAFVREKAYAQSFAQDCKHYRAKMLTLSKLHAVLIPLVRSGGDAGSILVVLAGSVGMLYGYTTAGDVAEFILYLQLLSAPLSTLGWITSLFQRSKASHQRVCELMQEQNPIVSARQLHPSALQGQISFEHVEFSYPGSSTKALRNISFKLEAGQSLAVVGPTGSGKSTLAKLLCRLCDPDKGAITLDGQPLSDYDVGFLRAQIGYVPQETFLLSDTVYANVAWGAEQPTSEQVVEAMRQAEIYEDVLQFPRQMHTLVGENGAALSGGQKQRLGIARALVRQPKLLILDDCFSAVDTQTEKRIITSLSHVIRHRTTFIISHRKSILEWVDAALVLEANGSVRHITKVY